MDGKALDGRLSVELNKCGCDKCDENLDLKFSLRKKAGPRVREDEDNSAARFSGLSMAIWLINENLLS